MNIKARQPNAFLYGAIAGLKRMGQAGFIFFFLKGMLWLIIPWLAQSALF